ncbi:MAG: EexN family lipoprotein [Nitrosospira sp.]|nr:EexN family lipoprotein [Nitrosospira sp.]
MEKTLIVPAVATLLLIAMLSGCDTRDVAEEVRTAEWYESHETERAQQLAECRTDPLLDATPNCINASRAENNAKASTKWATERDDVRTAPPPVPYP